MRKIALADDIDNLTDVEKNFDERVDRKKALQSELDKLIRQG